MTLELEIALKRRLGEIRAQIAALQAVEAQVKAEIARVRAERLPPPVPLSSLPPCKPGDDGCAMVLPPMDPRPRR